MRMAIPFTILHLIGAFVCALAAADAGKLEGRAKWIVVAAASVCAMLNAGAVVAELV